MMFRKACLLMSVDVPFGKCKTQVDRFNRFTGSRLTGHQVDRLPGLQVDNSTGLLIRCWNIKLEKQNLTKT